MNQLLRFFLQTVLLACVLPVSQAATVTIFASDARNISDFEEVFNGGSVVVVTDGDGDQRSLPVYPWLGAGIHLSGASGQNGTARFQLEFSLGSILGPVSSAFLVLNSDYKSNQTLDTFFSHVVTDEEGNVTVDDFQSSVEGTGIVQPPVLADTTHMYDVTSFVQKDLLTGFAFTSYQGRVDEGAANAFRRGVEYFSLALEPSANDDPMLRPRLVVTYAEIPEPGTTLLLGGGLVFLAAVRRRSHGTRSS